MLNWCFRDVNFLKMDKLEIAFRDYKDMTVDQFILIDFIASSSDSLLCCSLMAMDSSLI